MQTLYRLSLALLSIALLTVGWAYQRQAQALIAAREELAASRASEDQAREGMQEAQRRAEHAERVQHTLYSGIINAAETHRAIQTGLATHKPVHIPDVPGWIIVIKATRGNN